MTKKQVKVNVTKGEITSFYIELVPVITVEQCFAIRGEWCWQSGLRLPWQQKENS
jgi:hypothetical protein